MKAAGITNFEDTDDMENRLNNGKRFKVTKFLTAIILGMLIALAASIVFEYHWVLTTILVSFILLYTCAICIVYQKEKVRLARFNSLVESIKADETAVRAVLPGYDEILSRKSFRYDSDAFYYVLDWVRSQILRTVIMIGNGDESMRGELRIKFRIAEKLFGDNIGRGYDDYFSRHILERMKHHKEGFFLPAVIETVSAR